MNALTPGPYGRKGGGKSKSGGTSQSGSEVPDTVASRSTARIIDGLGEGEIGGLVNGMQSVFLDRTPVANADGTLNFKGFTLTAQTGTPDQDATPGFTEVDSEEVVSTQVKVGSPVTRTIDDEDLDAVLVKIQMPSLFIITANGGVASTKLEYAIDIQPNGGSFTEVFHENLKEKFGSTCEFQYRIPLPVGGAPWTIRVRRITPDATDSKTQNDTFWSTYTEVIDSKLSYPNTALAAIEVDAQEFGSDVPERAYEVIGTLIEVPANYDPETRVYATTGTGTSAGMWDGTFKMAPTDNPAWWLRWLMIEPRYGCGDQVMEASVDKWSLYEIAQYCDGLVPDGLGGMEPRFTFNYVINDKAEAYDVLRSIASVFNGFIYWGTGSIMAVADMPADADKLVTPSNVIGGNFNYEGTPDLARHSVALVTWNDPSDGYRTAVETVEDPDAIAELGWVPLEVLAYGCTSQGQAHRVGLWALDTERHENQTATWSASWDQADITPGRIAAVADPVIQGFRAGGRVAAGTTNSVTLDAPVTLESGETYEFNFIKADGTIETGAVTTGAGSTASLDIAPDFTEAPIAGAVWTLSSTVVAPRPFRVLQITESDKNIFEITALQHDPTKFARIEQGINLTPQNYSAIPTGPIQAPRGLSIQTYDYQSGAELKTGATLSWTPAPDARVVLYEVQVQRPGDAGFDVSGNTSGINFDIKDIGEGAISAMVRAFDGLGRPSQWATFNGVVSYGQPSDVSGFRISVVGSSAQLTWDPSPDISFWYMRIRFSPLVTGAMWENGIDLITQTISTSVSVAAMTGTYMIKAYNRHAKESTNASLIVADLGPISGFNAIDQVVEQPTFGGTKTDLIVVSDTLQIDLDAPATTGTYLFAADDLGDVYVSRISALIEVSGRNASNVMSSWVPLSSITSLSGTTTADCTTILEMRTTNDDPTGLPTWSPWAQLLVGDYSARAFEFRLTLTALVANVTPVVSRLEVSIDMADRIEQDNDVISLSTGTAITYGHAFRVGPAVSILGQGMATGDYYTIASKSVTGFTVQFFNSSNVGVSRTFDWIAKGGGIVL